MPYTVKFSNTTSTPVQSQIIPNATPRNDGVMSKEQAAKLEGLVGGTTVLVPLSNDIAAPTNNGSATDISTVGGAQFVLTVPDGKTSFRATYGGPRLVAQPVGDTANLVKSSFTIADGDTGLVLVPSSAGVYTVTPGQNLVVFGAVANVFALAPKTAPKALWSLEFTYLFE